METNGVNRKAIALLTLVFVLGIALGVVGTWVVGVRAFAARANPRSTSGNAGGQRAVNRLTAELGLTTDQQKQVTQILADMQTQYNGVRQAANPKYEEIRDAGHDQIRQILTPEQRPKFEVFLQRLQEERRIRENQNQSQNQNQNQNQNR